MDDLMQAGRITVKLRGFTFVMRRRSTFVMARARGFNAVVGQLSPEESGEGLKLQQYDQFMESVLRAALIEPRIAAANEEADPPNSYEYADLAPFAARLFDEFMNSGIDADPS